MNNIQGTYLAPGHPAAFSRPARVQEYHRDKKLKDVEKELYTLDSYNLHKEFKKQKFRNPFFVLRKREQIQMDLIDLKELAKFNEGYKYLILAIDIFTKKIKIIPLKNKKAQTTLDAIKTIFRDMGKYPDYLVTDQGSEFTNKKVKDFLNQRGIKYFYPSGEHKASIAERANRSIENIIFKYMTSRNTKKYIDKLSAIENTYNNRIHRTIKMTPNQAEQNRNQHKVRSIHFASHSPLIMKKIKPKLSENQVVRIQSFPSKFKRGYKKQATEEKFKIIDVKSHQPVPMYKLKSMDRNDVIAGNFYKNELSVVE